MRDQHIIIGSAGEAGAWQNGAPFLCRAAEQMFGDTEVAGQDAAIGFRQAARHAALDELLNITGIPAEQT